MARLVIRNRDKVNSDDLILDANCLKKGNVVDILENDQSLGTVGDAYDGWTVIDVRNVSKELLTSFTVPEPGDPLLKPMRQRRAFKFDLDQWVLDGSPPLINLGQAINYQRTMPPRTEMDPLGGGGEEL